MAWQGGTYHEANSAHRPCADSIYPMRARTWEHAGVKAGTHVHMAMRDSIMGRVPGGGGGGRVGTGSALIMSTPLYAHAVRPARWHVPGRGVAVQTGEGREGGWAGVGKG